MIRKATYIDIDSILKITKACAEFMIKKDIFQWNEHYPNKAVFEKDVLRDELYVIEYKSKIIGCIAISTYMDKEYFSNKWLTSNKKNIYIHRLAVHPKYQGKGFAQQLMNFAEQFAVTNKFQSVRLDTFSQNKRNQKFYELRNYKKLEEIYFPKQSTYPFYCYELVL